MNSIIRNYLEYPDDKKSVYPSYRSQRADLIAKKAPTKVPVKYANFAFSLDLASKLPKHIKINDYAIKLVDANGFIRPFILPTDAPRQA